MTFLRFLANRIVNAQVDTLPKALRWVSAFAAVLWVGAYFFFLAIQKLADAFLAQN